MSVCKNEREREGIRNKKKGERKRRDRRLMKSEESCDFCVASLAARLICSSSLKRAKKRRRSRYQLYLSAVSSFNTIVVVAATVAVFIPLPRLINGQQQWKVASRERRSSSSHKIQMYLVCVSWCCLRPPAKVYERDLLKVSATCFLLLYLPF